MDQGILVGRLGSSTRGLWDRFLHCSRFDSSWVLTLSDEEDEEDYDEFPDDDDDEDDGL
jgi:hypothetical protein